jgi:hypothetical protein
MDREEVAEVGVCRLEAFEGEEEEGEAMRPVQEVGDEAGSEEVEGNLYSTAQDLHRKKKSRESKSDGMRRN